ncbi:bifunctional DNA primase/polymerase [Chitinophaga sp.]|uniref:bifunctional DNA primase/polymerase n=1 Tax=Chitinophaga sp. TaxID=1869181 RepID=UPI0031E490F6
MSELLKAAAKYKQLGISSIATDANKRSVLSWKKFQEALPEDADLNEMFSNKKTEGIAVICGAVSGSLEVIDVDCKYDLTGSLFEDFMQLIVDDCPEIAGKLVIATTKGGGYHIYYRCETIAGNLKLARRETTAEERVDNPHEKVKVLIETRGEGGYVIASPTPGYKFTSGNPTTIPAISPEQREAIFEIARSFNQYIEQITHAPHYVEQRAYSKSPFQDFNERGDIIGLLQKHGWIIVGQKGAKTIFKRPGNTTSRTSGDWNSDLGFFSVFTTSSQFEPMKGYRPAAVYAMLECNNDFKEAAKKLIAEGFGEPYKKVSKDVKKFIRKAKEDGLEGEQLQAKVSSKFNLSLDDARTSIAAMDREEDAEDKEFWHWNMEDEKLSIIYTRFVRFLQDNGFGLYFYDKSSPIFKVVHNDCGRLEEATTERIKKFTQEYVTGYDLRGVEFTQEQLLEMIYKNNNLFSDALFEFLQPVNLDFLRDSKDTCYFPFRNGVIEINKEGFQLRTYGQVNKVIWRNDIINFNVDIDLSDDFDCEYSDFIGKICNNDANRILSCCSIIGYMLHKYKHPAKAFAVILGEETEDEAKGGGTGKGIFVKALEKMLNVETIDGKNFKPDKSFAYQRVKLETKLIVIQDAEKSFDFKKFYSIITEGLTIEKKNKDELYISYADSPKIMVTTNYTISDDGNHAKRRQKVVEFSNYFSPNNTPLDEYGHLLFEDWEADEWNRFYNFMFYCVRLYLKQGIIDLQQGDNYRRKKIKVQFGEEFMDWFEEYSGNGCAQWKEVTSMYSEFLGVNGFERKDYSQKRFKKGLQTAAENFGYTLETKKNSQNAGKYESRLLKPA